ncbi:DUF4149 domain-containing protein [Vandammella animalimorsus]|uniref:DUF4149 domain-containing protein n=1 Tax=Vandammella animalimorsus TaxID=2029117 RepID=UPI001EED483B|nr:DUF4149 domain-containing protein [Vandammella animalimorsus]
MPTLRYALLQRLPVMAAALWWGGLSVVGFLSVPLLFMSLPTAQAGQVAAKLFTAMTWLSVACGMLLVFLLKPARAGDGAAAGAAAPVPLAWTGWALAGVVLALLVEFGIAPRILARENLALWHNLATALYALQWLCAAVLLWRLGGRR